MRYYLGIDVGSSSTKGVLIEQTGHVLEQKLLPSGLDFAKSGQKVIAEILTAAGLSLADITVSCATGYGRGRVAASMTKTEIACHSRAAFAFAKKACTLVDIGGQDAKVIHIDNSGKVVDFKMNRSCAAGTGSFLEELARRAGLSLAELPQIAAAATKELQLNSYCTVFAASELIGLAREGAAVPDLVMAAYRAVAARVRELSTLESPVLFSGGVVTYHPQVAALLTGGVRPLLLPDAQFAGALGAALWAKGSDDCD